MALFIVSFTMSGLNIIATVFSMRAPGMSMWRLPLTVWSYLIASILGLLAFPPLTAAAVMLLLDRHFGTSFFLPSGLLVGNTLLPNQGGSPLLWQHLFWFLGTPRSTCSSFLRSGSPRPHSRRSRGSRCSATARRSGAWSLSGSLSMIVWGHHMFVSGMSPFTGEYFSLVTLTITVPMTIFGVNMLASLWGAQASRAAPMLFALGVLALFGTGGFGGLFLGNATADMQLHDTYFVVGHFHLMIGGVTLMATFAAIYYWFPKMFGRMMNETLGSLHFWCTFVPFFTIFFMQHFLGLQGAPRRYYAFTAYDYLKQTRGQNLVISIAAMVLIAGAAAVPGQLRLESLRGRMASANPWDATTLEWTAPSPPPHGNFGASTPMVHRWAYEYGVQTMTVISRSRPCRREKRRSAGEGAMAKSMAARSAGGSAPT